jgi:uncharacterized protein YbaA (DUF1428 family)
MYPQQQFGYGGLFGGGFGGFNPYSTFGAYDPYSMYGGYGGMLGNYGGFAGQGLYGNYGGMLGSLFGGANPYDDLFSSFQTKLDDLFKNYQTQLGTNAATGTTPPADTAAPADTTTTTTTPESKQVSWDKKTSKYGSQAEKQTAYDKIMNDPNASAEAKAMAEKGNVYGASRMGNTENAATPAPSTAAPQYDKVSYNANKSRYGSQAEKQAAYENVMSSPQASAEAKRLAQQGKIRQADKLISQTQTYAKNPNPARNNPRYR